MAKVWIPPLMRSLTDGQQIVEAEGESVRELVAALEERFPGIKTRVLDDVTGDIHPFVSIFLNDNDIMYLRGLETEVKDGDEIVIVPAIAGGAA